MLCKNKRPKVHGGSWTLPQASSILYIIAISHFVPVCMGSEEFVLCFTHSGITVLLYNNKREVIREVTEGALMTNSSVSLRVYICHGTHTQLDGLESSSCSSVSLKCTCHRKEIRDFQFMTVEAGLSGVQLFTYFLSLC